jgi:hypothetical protein
LRDLLDCAAEDQRIAGFEPHDAPSRPGEADHHGVDRMLRAARPAGAPADRDAPCLATGEFEDIAGDEVVEQDDVGILQRAHRLQRQQFRFTWARTDEGHMAMTFHVGGSRHRIVEDGFRRGVRRGAEGAVDESFPEVAPLRAGRQAVDHPPSQTPSQHCPRSQWGR